MTANKPETAVQGTFCYHVYNMYMVHVHVHVYGKGEMYIEQQWQQINHVVLAHDGNLFL